MALEVEDGTGKTDAESYISVTDADTYFSKRGITLWATLLTEEKEQALRRSTDYLGQVYRLRWKGARAVANQALDWPRSFVEQEDYEYAGLNGYTMIGGQYYYPSNAVPVEVMNACAEMAFKAASGELAPDLDRAVTREKVDVIEVEYDRYATQYKQYRAIDNLLAPFLASVGGAFRKVVRT